MTNTQNFKFTIQLSSSCSEDSLDKIYESEKVSFIDENEKPLGEDPHPPNQQDLLSKYKNIESENEISNNFNSFL